MRRCWPKPCRADLSGFAQHDRSLRDEHMLAIVRIDGIRYQDLDRTGGIAVETIHENRVERHTLIDHVGLACSGVDIDLRPALRCGSARPELRADRPPRAAQQNCSPPGRERPLRDGLRRSAVVAAGRARAHRQDSMRSENRRPVHGLWRRAAVPPVLPVKVAAALVAHGWPGTQGTGWPVGP